jgi:hypothetical protein
MHDLFAFFSLQDLTLAAPLLSSSLATTEGCGIVTGACA